MKYQLIYADPAWEFKSKKTGGSMKSGALNHYSTMTIDQIKGLDVSSICSSDCFLAMWYVSSQPQEALDVCAAWGFKVKHMNGFIWNKLTVNYNPFFGMGYYTRAGAESCLFAVKGKPKVVNHSVRQVRSAPVGRHSEKPGQFRDDLIKILGDVPRAELFAREKIEGWHSFGNEIKSDFTL